MNLSPARRPTPPIRAMLVALGATLALWLHFHAWATVAPDMYEYVLPWYRHIVSQGMTAAFGTPFSNYTPAYLYLLAAGSLLDPLLAPITVIKLVSVGGTIALAASVHGLLKAAKAEWRLEGALLVFLLPTPLLNGPYLGQCDAYWVAACVMAVAAALRGRMMAMLIWCGLAFSFKAQAAFLAPFVVAMLIQHRSAPILWLIPAAIYGLVMTPAWMAGWPAFDLLLVYPLQSVHFETAGNLANPWVAVGHLTESGGQGYFWIGYAAAFLAAMAFTARFATIRLAREQLLAAALLSAFMLPWLLPKMHERYWLLADVLAFALAITSRNRTAVLIAVAVNAASGASIFSYVTDWSLPVMLAAAVSGFGLLVLLQLLSRSTPQATSLAAAVAGGLSRQAATPSRAAYGLDSGPARHYECDPFQHRDVA